MSLKSDIKALRRRADLEAAIMARYLTVPRSYPSCQANDLRSFPSLADAIVNGLKRGKPFDVHLPSGAVAWTWEQRLGAESEFVTRDLDAE